MSHETDEDFIQNFADRIKQADDKLECIQTLIQSIQHLLTANPNPDEGVIASVCEAITQGALVSSVCSVAMESDGLEFIIQLIGTLSAVDWTKSSRSLIGTASGAACRSLVMFRTRSTACMKLIASFVRVLFDTLSGDSLYAVGGAFPSDLPSTMYASFEELGLFEKMKNLVSMYTEMSGGDFANILKVISSFLRAMPSCVNTLISDSTHFMLLFAAQHFPSVYEVQDALWTLLTILLLTGSRDFILELTPPVLCPAISSYIVTTECSVLPVASFLSEYISITNSIKPPFVLFCFEEHPELVLALLHKLNPSRTLTTKAERDEVGSVAELLEAFFYKYRQCSTYKHIMKYQLLDTVLKASVEWPDLCCMSYCIAIKHILGHFPPDDIADKHPSLMHILKEPLEDKKDFCQVNRLESFIELLNSSVMLESEETRVTMYDTMRQLLILAPDSCKTAWVTDNLLKCVVTSIPKDVKAFPSKMYNFVFLGHFLVFLLGKERMEIIRDQKWHEVAVNDCLKLADTDKSLNCCLGFAASILQGFNQAFKDSSLFAETDFPQMIMDMARKHGLLGVNGSFCDTFGSLLLTLTADKQSSLILYNKQYLDQLYPLVDDKYETSVIRPAIHAIGNIALAGHNIKQEILDRDFHSTLINYLETNLSTADAYVLSACCRVLHILASGDSAKRQFAERGLVEILIRMLETRQENAEVCWRPLGLLSSLGFMSLSNREYVITKRVLKTVVNLLKTTTHSKVKSYTALVFLASVDSDRRSIDLQKMQVTEIFQQVLQDTDKSDPSYEDLQKWGQSLLEKGQLFTIPLTSAAPDHHVQRTITWPVQPSTPGEESVDGAVTCVIKQNLDPKFPMSPELSPDDISQVTKLGIDPRQIFRVGRLFGSSHGQCSNCDKEGRSEELVFRPENLTPHQYQELIMRGWYRRGGVKLYRYRYNHDLACSDWETRVTIAEFDHRKHKSYKKVLKRMPEDRLTIKTIPTQFIPEAFDLYNSYHLAKHDKPVKSETSYCEHIVNSPLRNQSIDGFEYGSFHQLYYLDDKLVAVGVIDVVPNGVVSVYMWYSMNKEISKYSFGVYSALKEIEYTRELSKRNPNIKYYYLQGWNEKNHKLSYKARYEPEEFYSPCTVTDWVMSLEGVKKEQDIAKEKWRAENPSDAAQEDDKEKKGDQVPGDALSLDRLAYHAHNGPADPDIMNTVICINHRLYMYLRDMLDTYSVGSSQKELMVNRLRELHYALGNGLTKNMIVDVVACPLSS